MARTKEDLVNIAGVEAGVGALSSEDISRYSAWFDFRAEAIINRHNLVWSFKKLVVDDIQSIQSDNTLYKYAYTLPDNIIDVYAINVDDLAINTNYTSFDAALRHGVRLDLYQEAGMASPSDSGGSFVKSGPTLYSTIEIKSLIIKQVTSVDRLPIEFQDMMIDLVAMIIATDRGLEIAANSKRRSANTKEITVISKRSVARDVEQEAIITYFRRVARLSRIFT